MDQLPAGVKRIRKGMGWADNPEIGTTKIKETATAATKEAGNTAGTLSFGGLMSTCALLGLISTKEMWINKTAQEQHQEPFLRKVASVLESVEIDPKKPYKAKSKYSEEELKRAYWDSYRAEGMDPHGPLVAAWDVSRKLSTLLNFANPDWVFKVLNTRFEDMREPVTAIGRYLPIRERLKANTAQGTQG